MKKLITFIALTFCVTALSVHAKQRDPFWPIEYEPSSAQPVGPKTPDDPPPETAAPLTDAELMELALQESRRISESFQRRATLVTNGKIFAHVGESNIVSRNPWVTEGDFFIIEMRGQRYRMKVVKLTRSQIQLEPQRMTQAP